jgi:hypothetical protein
MTWLTIYLEHPDGTRDYMLTHGPSAERTAESIDRPLRAGYRGHPSIDAALLDGRAWLAGTTADRLQEGDA